MKRAIFTGDDFGLAVPVNEAIADAHSRGVLTCASLMVSAEASRDAVDRARSLPSLHVGLHLVLVEGRPLLPRDQVPDLTSARGELSERLVLSGFRFFFVPGIRSQLEAEIRAQFEAFEATGLRLDHVNTHNHMHLHPTVLDCLLKIGREFGLRAIRLPHEPPLQSFRAAGKSLVRRSASHFFLYPLIARMKRRLREEKLHANDFCFGMRDSGAMTLDLVLSLLKHMPEGVCELHFHPATRRCAALDRTMREYRHEEEYRALIDPRLREAIRSAGVHLSSFADL
jgi:hopanoid biosynthesis associated protein HpnK